METTLIKDGYSAAENLDEYKQVKCGDIDCRTKDIISSGFTYNSNVFSLSVEAQINITNIMMTSASLTYPLVYPMKDNSGSISLADSAEVAVFYSTALAAKKSALDSGNVLKNQVNACATIEEVNAIVDNR